MPSTKFAAMPGEWVSGVEPYAVLAIDPGEKHVGLAYFEWWKDWDGGPVCVWAREAATPDEACDEVLEWIEEDTLNALVVEEFRLYPWKSQQQGFSQLKTVEVIGVLRWMHKAAGIPRGVAWYEQQAAIQEPTKKMLAAEKIVRMSKGQGPHALSAELHGWHHMLRRREAWNGGADAVRA